MGLADTVKRWREAISLFLLCIVWTSLLWEVLRGLFTEGPSVVNTLYKASLIVMLLLTLGALGYEIRQTAAV